MKLIPDTPFDTNSYAERRVFNLLKECFSDDDSFISFHSFNLTSHEKKRVGEVDFLILCKYGLFVLEVKGGVITQEAGRWFTENTQGKHSLGYGPFKQANGAMFSIEKTVKIETKFSPLNIPIGYGVIFPDCIWELQDSEWDRATVCDSRNMRNLERWLMSLFIYWNGKPNNNALISSSKINELSQFLRPNFELSEQLYETILNTETKAMKLTEDQYLYVDIAMENKRVLCAGGAGTGKTFLAVELVRRKSAEHKNVLFVCKSPWLKNYLESRVINDRVIVTTIKGVNQAVRRSGLESFDVLIVDEGQDLFNFEDIYTLEACLYGGLTEGEWYIFHDINNQSGLLSKTSKEVLEYLNNRNNPTKVSLKTNCRNTLHILSKIKNSLQLDMGNKGTGNGPKVFEVTLPAEELVRAISDKIIELLDLDIFPGSITILSAVPFNNSIVSLLPNTITKLIQELDSYSARNFPIDKLNFAEVKDFKGMENEVIILVDLPCPSILERADNKTLHYVGMSRARGLLCAFWNEKKI